MSIPGVESYKTFRILVEGEGGTVIILFSPFAKNRAGT